MYKSEALSAKQLLALLAKYCGPRCAALITERIDSDFGDCVGPPIAIEVTLPKAWNAEGVLAIIASESRSAILALLALLLGLDDLAIRDRHKKRLVLEAVSLRVHGLKTAIAEVVFTIATEHLGLLHVTGGAEAPNSRCELGVVPPRPFTVGVQVIKARAAE